MTARTYNGVRQTENMKKELPAKKRVIGLLGVGLAIAIHLSGGAMNIRDLSLPGQIGEWQSQGSDQTYDRQTLYKYIDGGAELYLAYDFRAVLSRTYTGPTAGEIVLDVYDMGSAADAFGIFTSEREETEAHVGQGSEFGGGLLRFWKGNFFVSVLANGGSIVEEDVLEIGKRVAAAIPENGAEPALLTFLPAHGLDREKICYFHFPLQLEKRYFVADENILGLNPKTECLLAECPLPEGDPIILLIVRYENAGLADAAYKNFLRIYMPEAAAGLAQMENGKWTLAQRRERSVIIAFEAPDQEQAAAWMAAIKNE